MKIDANMLMERGACLPQVRRFTKLFGRKGGVVTKEKCLKTASVFAWDWAARMLLPQSAQRVYFRETMPAEKAFDAVWKEERARRTARVKRSIKKLLRIRAAAFWKASRRVEQPPNYYQPNAWDDM